MANNLYLTGMMGAGKSVTGKSLAGKLNRAFVDLDHKLEKNCGKEIAQIFADEGEQHFRVLEAALLKKISQMDSTVIATGGGIVLNSGNVQIMKDTGKIIYLKSELETLWQRVRHQTKRPLLHGDNPRANLEKRLADRLSFYESCCDYTVVTDGKSADAVADDILKVLELSL